MTKTYYPPPLSFIESGLIGRVSGAAALLRRGLLLTAALRLTATDFDPRETISVISAQDRGTHDLSGAFPHVTTVMNRHDAVARCVSAQGRISERHGTKPIHAFIFRRPEQ